MSGNEQSSVAEVHFSDTGRLRTYLSPLWSEWSAHRLVTMEDIVTFSKLTNNHQWIHDDEERCQRESPYGAIIAHGFLILVLLPSLLPPEPFAVTGHTKRIVRGGTFRFPSPVFPGDTLRSRARLRAVRVSKNGKGTILIRDTEIWSTIGTKPAVTCSLQLQYF